LHSSSRRRIRWPRRWPQAEAGRTVQRSAAPDSLPDRRRHQAVVKRADHRRGRQRDHAMRASSSVHDRPAVVVLGCDDVGSAIARTLHGSGAAVVLIDDADPPWAPRGMSYTDAWYAGGATLERVDACFCGSVRGLPAVLARGDMIAATTWSAPGVAATLRLVAVVEARPGCAKCRAQPARLSRECADTRSSHGAGGGMARRRRNRGAAPRFA